MDEMGEEVQLKNLILVSKFKVQMRRAKRSLYFSQKHLLLKNVFRNFG
jgi:hypothetical protein